MGKVGELAFRLLRAHRGFCNAKVPGLGLALTISWVYFFANSSTTSRSCFQKAAWLSPAWWDFSKLWCWILMICFRYSRPTNLSSINIVERKIKFCSFLISLPGSFASVSPWLEAFFGYGLFTHTRTSETEYLTVLFII